MSDNPGVQEVDGAEMEGFAEQLMQDLPPSDVRHVLAVFAADLARLAGVLGAACRAGDPEAFVRAAHALAGAAGAVGAASLERACRTAMTGAEAHALAARLATVLAAAREAETDLARFLSQADAPGV